MVESFIATQKYSLQRELSKRLRAYVVLPTDFFPVLLHLLRDLVRSEKRALQLTGEYDEGAGVAVSIRWVQGAHPHELACCASPAIARKMVLHCNLARVP